jgi:hypothetical protein
MLNHKAVVEIYHPVSCHARCRQMFSVQVYSGSVQFSKNLRLEFASSARVYVVRLAGTITLQFYPVI